MGVFQNLTALITLKDNTRAGSQSVVSNLNRIANALDVTRLAATRTFKIDNDIRRMGVQMGMASEQISRLSMSVVTLANSTGVSTEKIDELATAYMATGRTLDVNDDKARAHAQTMTELAGRFGWTASEAVKTDVTLDHLGTSIEALTDRVTGLQDTFDIPGMIGQIPKVALFAEQMLTRFGKTTVGNLNKIIDTTLKTSATYARAFGVDAARALQMAQQQQENFLTQMQQGRDVFLGLEDDFGGIYKAFFETGRGLDEVNRLLQLGQENPAAYAREVLRIRDNYLALGQTTMAEHFFQNVLRNSDEATRALIANKGALEALEEANRQKEVTKGFTQLTDAFHSIGTEVVTTVGNLMFLGKTILGLTFLDVVTDSFKGITDRLRSFNEAIVEGAQSLKDSAFFKELRPVLVGIGKVLIGVGAAAGMLASTFASTIIPFRLFVKIAEGLPVIGTGVKPVMALVGTLVEFTKQGLNFAGVAGAIAVALEDFGSALKDPNLSLTETLFSGISAAAIGITEAFDAVLGGLPSTLAKAFFKTDKTLGESVRGMFNNLRLALQGSSTSMVGGWWKSIKEETGRQFDAFVAYLDSNFAGKQETAKRWGENIGRAIGTMADWARDLIAPLFTAGWWREKIDTVVKFLSGEGSVSMTGATGTIFNSIMSHGSTFIKSFTNEVLRPFGMGFEEVKSKFLDLHDAFRVKFDWLKTMAWPELQMRWLELKISFVEGFYQIKDSAIFAFDLITSHGQRTLGTVGEFIASIRKRVADYRLESAEEAWEEAKEDSSLSDEEKNNLIKQLIAARREARAANEQQERFGEMAKAGQEGLAGIYDADSKRRAESAEAASTLLGPSKARLAELQTSYPFWADEHKARVEEWGRGTAERHAAERTTIQTRNFAQANEDVQNQINSLLTQYEKRPIIDQTDRIAAALRTSDPELYSRFEDIRGNLSRAQTPEDVHRVWGELKKLLRGDAEGRTAAAGVGANLDETVYRRPSPTQQFNAGQLSPEQSAMLKALQELTQKQVGIQNLTQHAQALASQGHINASQALEAAARALAESARQMQTATQGAHGATAH